VRMRGYVQQGGRGIGECSAALRISKIFLFCRALSALLCLSSFVSEASKQESCGFGAVGITRKPTLAATHRCVLRCRNRGRTQAGHIQLDTHRGSVHKTGRVMCRNDASQAQTHRLDICSWQCHAQQRRACRVRASTTSHTRRHDVDVCSARGGDKPFRRRSQPRDKCAQQWLRGGAPRRSPASQRSGHRHSRKSDG